MSKGERTRNRILDQALDLASVNGLEGLSIGTLARHTGMSKSGMFAHFGSKSALQREVLKAAVAKFIDRVVVPGRTGRRGVVRLDILFENWLAWAEDDALAGGCPFVAAAVEWDDREGPLRDYLVGVTVDWFNLIGGTAKQAMADGAFRADLDIRQFAHDLYAIFLGYHHASRLLRTPRAHRYARDAYKRLIQDAGADH
ncbi:MAG: TetR/AcrR family transcriptional regulator [Alphaproteobacteria bacterium]|nr:TetR/AcrR family transcriptional regulator [Alphaproteobacteria bacterium]